jgi:hypothetical protein
MLNFTFSEPEDLPAIENVLGQAIMQRVNQHIVFQEPSVDDLRRYLLELFRYNRLDEKKTSPTFPFSEEAFELLTEASASKTPRFMNKLCDKLLREVKEEWATAPRKQREITKETVEEKLPRLLSSLEESRG